MSGRSCGTAGGAHSQFNRVARQLNERSRETLGFSTRAKRDLMQVLHRPIERTPQSGHRSRRRECSLCAIFGIMRGKKLFGGVLVQAGALLINHIAPRRRTLTPSA
jgi:hypothetical protein